jgi:CBS domain-containing protein
MITKVGALIREKGLEVIAVDSEATVAQAMNKMVERNIGAVLVMEGGNPSGMFTERDVMKCWNAKKDFNVPVKEVMTRDLFAVQADDELSYAMSIMIQKGIRHLPVADKGTVVSVLSIRDVVRAQVSSLEAEVHYLKEFITTAG